MRVLAVILILLLAGCSTKTDDPAQRQGPEVADVDPGAPSDFGQDIEAPRPTDFYEEARPEATDRFEVVRGKVLSTTGFGVRGASVWVEGPDLREPVNNIAEYMRIRNETLVRTDNTGNFEIQAPKGSVYLMVDKPGYLPQRVWIDEADAPIRLKDRATPTGVAHRGASFYAPENTQYSLQKAALLGAEAVEIDVRMAGDGTLVVFHDNFTSRTTGRDLYIHDATWAQLRELDVGLWFDDSFVGAKIPRLTQMFQWAQDWDVELIVDVKADVHMREATWTAVIESIQAHHMEDRAVFAAFRQAAVGQCAEAGLRCALLGKDPEVSHLYPQRAYNLGAEMIMVDFDLIDRSMVERASALGLSVNAWTLNRPDDWDVAVAIGVSSISTDRSGYLLDWRNGRLDR